jgi:glycosidase
MKKNHFLLAISFTLLFSMVVAQSLRAQQNIRKVVFQAFWWNFSNNNFPNGWSNYLCELAPRLRAAGFNAVWIPPSYKNGDITDGTYSPFDYYDLGDKYQKGGNGVINVNTALGNKDELLRMIAVMHANGIEVIQDVVLNQLGNAGANNGNGGYDPESPYSIAEDGGYHNFRFVSYATPLLDESQNDYWTRSGRWPKNYTNFHPNAGANCTTGDICTDYFGPDIAFETGSYGQSSNIPTNGTATINGITRPYINPVQQPNYMEDSGRVWIEWLKKQTGADGWRLDDAKGYQASTQEDYIYNTRYTLPSWAKGNDSMFCVSEYIDDGINEDAYLTSVKTGLDPDGTTNEINTGTFDFGLRGYGYNSSTNSGGIYSMVLSSGSYNMQSLPAEQQQVRSMTYSGNTLIYRTVPFVNDHDTYRPILTVNGNFSQPLGNAGGWNTGSELGGNGQHIDPREPRLAAAYAFISSIDGNPDFFFEDMFDIGTTGKRYTHLPTDAVGLPIRSDLQNIILASQRLSFKDGSYLLPTSSTYTGNDAPYYQSGNAGDHLVIERSGHALIGISDYYSAVSDNSQDELVYVTTQFPIGTVLYDYSGAHGITADTVTNFFGDNTNHRVLIRTAPVGHTIANANGHGYSIWAPAPPGVTVASVNTLYNYLVTYTPTRNPQTTQEWEMADDLGDCNCNSSGQSGSLPSNSTNQRVVGKIFVANGKQVTYKVIPQTDGTNVTAFLCDLNGNMVSLDSGITTNASPLTGTYTATSDGWLTIKLRNTNTTSVGQKYWVDVTYTAPQIVNTRTTADSSVTRVSIWTGNAGTSNIATCGNWEEGKVPVSSSNVIIPAYSSPSPIITSSYTINNLFIEKGASLTVNSGVTLTLKGNCNVGGTWVGNTLIFQ